MGLLALLVTLAVGSGIYEFLHGLASKEASPENPVAAHEVVRTVLATLTFAGAVLAGVYAYRKQRLAESDAHRADEQLLAERFTTAAEQLGHDQAAVRLAGVYAMARLADDWIEQRQVCVDVLCAYLRMPYEPNPEAASTASEGESLSSTPAAYKEGEREVRLTIIRTIRSHLQPEAPTSWSACNFDFTRATFDGGYLQGSLFQGTVSFGGAEFSGRSFYFGGADFSAGRVYFGGANFSGGRVDFRGAKFSGASVDFTGAKFSRGSVYFGGAKFSAGSVDFTGAKFSGGTVTFIDAEFSGGTVTFVGAKFSRGSVDFSGAKFSAGSVDFSRAKFSGSPVTFIDAVYSGGTVDFEDVTGAPQNWGPFRPTDAGR
ncbi:pentapeptide repeat-containing protein [Streptomyces spororaveus]|uniref:pentapeptide repeat-containing protein n=1 Tax=Streptomyces spororaveus TaxID=284039 RepID=UPI001F306992|nr:pentapeptide repeat-containing protein [Streptomyces spororaveus]